MLEEEVSAIGADAVRNIINLAQCLDGVYEVVTCNESRDFESGHIDGYDLMLVRFEE